MRSAPRWLFPLLLTAATLLVYLPALPGRLLWDDDTWTTRLEPLLRDLPGLARMWMHPTTVQGYPLTGTTFWLDHQLWGSWTLPYHVENVLLHAGAALLFWRVLVRLAVPAAWLAAAIFALHPVMAESVAWITERKNVLAQVLFLAAVLAYGRAVGFRKEDAGPMQRRSYALAVLLFGGALFSKITVAVLPPALLVLAWWQRGRLRWREDVLPVLPFFALAIAYGPLAMSLEDKQLAAGGDDWNLAWPERVLIAGRVLWFYPGKLLWPAELAFIHPRWVPDAGSVAQWLFPLAAVAVLLGAWMARDRIGRGPAAALFYYSGALFPVLGFMDIFFMRYSFVADHWVYLASLGLFALAAASLARLAVHLRQPGLVPLCGAIVLPVLAFLTWQQAQQYRDPETLWRTTIARNPAAWLAHHDLGVLLLDHPPLDEAIALFRQTIALRPGYAEAHYNLGTALLRQGRLPDAVAAFGEAIRLRPAHPEAHNNLGYTFFLGGKPAEAIAHYRRALELRPDYADAHANLGLALHRAGAFGEARAHFESALRTKPRLWPALSSLAMLLATAPAAADRDAPRALLLAEEARRLTAGRDPSVLHTLGAAQAALGRFTDASATAEAALALATAQGQRPLAEILRQSLALYRQGKPLP